MIKLFRISGVLFLLVSSISRADINSLNTEKATLLSACPTRWESLDIMMNAEQIEEGDIWADAADFLAWQTYLTSLTQAQGLTSDDLTRMSRDELTVVTECMAQRVKVMLMMGGTPLGESGLAYLNDSEVIAQQPENEEENFIIGTVSTYPADSCQQIKESTPLAESSFYWVRLNSLDILNTYRVFCEMEHAGGGWMYWGYVGSSADIGLLYEQGLPGYDVARRRPDNDQVINNVFPLNQYADTEMVVVLAVPDIQYAKQQNKYVRYRYAVDSVAFNNGPLPCQGLDEALEYTLDDSNFNAATINTCTTERWYPKASGNNLSIIRINYGIYWGAGMGGNDTYGHNAWIYVR